MPLNSLPDHYATLEVDRSADESSIKKSYRRKVLIWHPDKHPVDREVAEKNIRQINDAYETLSNPLKRGQYDSQLSALERQAKGFRADTSGIQPVQPRMSIPKEFMLCPMGYPDKFVRCVGSNLFVNSREDTDLPFEDFFKAAKFSLWWLPQVNNMCHIRAQSSAGQGERGGLNVTFTVSENIPGKEAKLSHIQDPPTFFKVVNSPIFQGAFRFECQYFPGYYLVFRPPTYLQITNSLEEGPSSIDFMLVDYASSFKYKTLEEVLVVVIEDLGGNEGNVNMHSVCEHKETKAYFQNVLKKAVWSQEDFDAYFDGHYKHWNYDPRRGQVRIRSKEEKLTAALNKATSCAELVLTVASAGDELNSISIDVATKLIMSLSRPLPQDSDVTAFVNHLTAQKNIMVAMPQICRSISLQQLLSLYPHIAAFGGEQVAQELMPQRDEIIKRLCEIARHHICDTQVQVGEITNDSFQVLCSMPLDWVSCINRVRDIATFVFASLTVQQLCSLLNTCSTRPEAKPIVSEIGAAVLRKLPTSPHVTVVQAIELLVNNDLAAPSASEMLLELHLLVPFDLIASAVATMAEKGREDENVKECAHFLGSCSDKVISLPTSTILRLAVVATKSASIANSALAALASAATLMMHTWTMDDVSKMLLALAKAKFDVDVTAGARRIAAARGGFFRRAVEIVTPQLSGLSVTHLLKMTLAIGRTPACRHLFEALAEEALTRVYIFSVPQLLLLTQGCTPLETKHPLFQKLLDFWFQRLQSRNNDASSLSADQLAKLLSILVPVVSDERIIELLVKRLSEVSDSLSPSGNDSLETAFPGGRSPDIRGLSALLRRVRGDARSPRRSQSRSPRRFVRNSRDRRRSHSAQRTNSHHRR